MISSTPQINVLDIASLETYPEKRDCYAELAGFIHSGETAKGKIAVLYGIRRTGKTVMMNQLAKELADNGNKCLYLSCSDERVTAERDRLLGKKHNPAVLELLDILDQALKEKYKYVFIDELTFIKDFIGHGHILANCYSAQGLNIIAAGTDSLSFMLSAQDDMYDRIRPVHTTYVSFAEYSRLLGRDLDDYIRFGGTLKAESPYKDGSSTIEYTNKAIISNIIRSTQANEHLDGQALTLLYPEKDIISAINRCINQMNQDFLISAISRNNGIFQSHPLHLGIANSRKVPYRQYLDAEALDEQVRKALDIINKDDMTVKMYQSDIDLIRSTLVKLDLVLTVPTYTSVNEEPPIRDKDMQIISQAGMVYCHATELLKLLTDDANWHNLQQCGLDNKADFIRRIDRQVKGDILENLIIYDTFKALEATCYVTKLRRKTDSKEIDLVITDKASKDTYLFEVKYSQVIDQGQTRNLASEDFISDISRDFGEVKGRFVIYNGPKDSITDALGSVGYLPAADYLKAVTQCKDISQLLQSI